MKKLYFLLLTITTVYLTSCSNSPTDKAQSSVKSYLKENLKNSGSYEPLSFSKLDTLNYASAVKNIEEDLKDDKKEKDKYLSELLLKKDTFKTSYSITHEYSVINSDKDKVKMSVRFKLDQDFKIVEKSVPKSINGEYGSLTGNAYWKYNDYVGNKADAGAEITLYSLDTIRGNLKFETTADVQGNYKIEKILPGSYFLIVRSKNATDCPDRHLSMLDIYSDDIKQLFGFDIKKYKTQLDEIKVLDDIYSKSSDDFPSNGSLAQMKASIAKTDAISKQITEKIENLFEMFPDDFKSKIKFYTGYSNAYDFSNIRIEEGETENIITDFGITCI